MTNVRDDEEDCWSGVINPQYPASWWVIGFSDEVRESELIPVRFLERDVVLWRDAAGKLHCQSAICPHLGANIGYGGAVVGDCIECPFHGYTYDSFGALAKRRGEDTPASSRLRLRTYTVVERYGTIFVWNGTEVPDHDVPSLEEIFPDIPSLRPEDVLTFQFGFFLPFPAKWFLENVPDANHFGVLHRVAEFAEAEEIEETPRRFTRCSA